MAYSADIKATLENPECCATLLHAICLRQYGEQFYVWDPSTVALELKDDFYAELPSENMDKISAIQLLISSGEFFSDPAAFFAVCSSVADGDPLFDVFDPPSMEEISWAVSEVALNRELLPFSYAIKQIIKTMGTEYGFNNNNMPTAIRELLEATPDEDDIQEAMGAVLNGENIDVYMSENVAEMAAQFKQVPGLAELFPRILEDGVIPVISKLRDQ
jgi:hypothetical protein